MKDLTCSVVIPCYNEAENIVNCFNRIPKLGKSTEVIFVDDGSTDNAKNIIEDLMHRSDNIKLVSYAKNLGKGYAIQEGLKVASGDILMILDAAMAVPRKI